MRLLLSFILLAPFWLNAQVTTEPDFPSADEEIRIIYDATLGTSGLQGSSDVYLHAGVILESSTSTSWQNVVGNWGQDDGIGEMTPVSGESDKWEITLTPRDYFSVESNVEIFRIGMVFRNADGSIEGKSENNQDIFVEINNGQFSFTVESPTSNYKFYNTTETIDIIAKASEEATIELFIDDVLTTTLANTTILETTHDVIIDGQVHVIRLTATNGSDTEEKSFSYSSTPTTLTQPLPQGVIKGINYHSNNTSVTLVLEAPFKENVYLLGDFNNWQLDNDYLMYQDGELFWLTINDLTPNQSYVFQYLIDGDLLIADPYTDQVSDPWGDKHIEEARYPNLVQYPEGKTEFRASVLETGQQPYNWNVTNFVAPLKENLVIYELLVRDFDDKQTYQGVIDRLDYLQQLGINALELMPVNEFEGNLSWGYNPNFYFAPDKYYGHKNDLKKLIDECHSRGIAVLIDIVLNHSFHSSPLVRMYQSNDGKPSAENPWYNVEHNFQNPDAHWGADFDHESLYTQQFVDSINTYWLEEYKVDGFRFDFTKGIGNNIKSSSSDSWGSLYDSDRIRLLKRMSDKVWEVKASAYVIFEHLSDNTEELELANHGIMMWANMNHNYTEMVMGWTNGINLDWGFYGTWGLDEPNLITYMESHDEERMMYKNLQWGNSDGSYSVQDISTALKRVESASAFFYTIPGPKMIWQFGELGYDISIDEGGRTGEKPIKWEYYDEPSRQRLYQVTSTLIALKNTYSIFQTSDVQFINDNSLHKQLTLKNEPYTDAPASADDMNVVVVGNFDVKSVAIDVQFPHLGQWSNYFNHGLNKEVTSLTSSLILAPGEFRIFTDVELAQPDIDVLTTFEEYGINLGLTIYPNPARNTIAINDIGHWEEAEIVNIVGGNIYKMKAKNNLLDITGIPSGLYLLSLKNTNGERKHLRFIKE